MRNSLKMLVPLSILALSACSDATEGPLRASEDSAEARQDEIATQSESAGASAPGVELSQIPVTLPKLAYVFDYGFRLAGEAIAPLQQQHADMCEAQGPYVCRIVSLSHFGEDPDEIRGELQLAVASDKARGFGALLATSAEAVDAKSYRADIQGEDLSKSLVDTQARLRSRIALRDRLMEVLRTRRGTVEQLVEAERHVATVNEEIDQAQSWLREQEGRVAFSRMTLTYESATPGGSFFNPIKGALGSLGAILGNLAAVLIVIGAVALPLLAGALGFRTLGRRLGFVANA